MRANEYGRERRERDAETVIQRGTDRNPEPVVPRDTTGIARGVRNEGIKHACEEQQRLKRSGDQIERCCLLDGWNECDDRDEENWDRDPKRESRHPVSLPERQRPKHDGVVDWNDGHPQPQVVVPTRPAQPELKCVTSEQGNAPPDYQQTGRRESKPVPEPCQDREYLR